MQQNENFAKQAEQAEAERPEVVAYFDRNYPSTGDAFIWSNYEGSPYEPVMTVSQHERIVGELRADRDSWAEQAEQRLADWDEMRKERDAALARVAELELKLDKSDYAYDNDRIHMRGLAARAIARAKVFDDGSDGADAESARSVVAILRELLAVGPAQAQHSVPIAPELKRALGLVVAALEADGDRPTSKYALSELKKVLAAAPGKEGV